MIQPALTIRTSTVTWKVTIACLRFKPLLLAMLIRRNRIVVFSFGKTHAGYEPEIIPISSVTARSVKKAGSEEINSLCSCTCMNRLNPGNSNWSKAIVTGKQSMHRNTASMINCSAREKFPAPDTFRQRGSYNSQRKAIRSPNQ